MGHWIWPPRTPKRQMPGCGGLRLDCVHSSVDTPACRDVGSDQKSVSGVSPESNPACAGVHAPEATEPGGQNPALPPLASPASQPQVA